MTKNFQNPALIFLEKHTIGSVDEIVVYTDFLRSSAGLDVNPPIDLEPIYEHFGIPLPIQVQLPNQQGLTIFNNCVPTIVINDSDSGTRQRFTEAHELIELLFHELPGEIRIDRLKDNIFSTRKERICQLGAANLLMPIQSFLPKASELGISIQSAEQLAREYEVSLMAALFRLADIFPNKVAITLWSMKNKPSELQNKTPQDQMQLPGFSVGNLPSPKLRVDWSYGYFQNTHIPNDKSVGDDSCVYSAWEKNCPTTGEEFSPFGRYNRRIKIENKPVMINAEKFVLSLIREPDKYNKE